MTDADAKAAWNEAMRFVRERKYEEALKVDMPWSDKRELRLEIAKAKRTNAQSD